MECSKSLRALAFVLTLLLTLLVGVTIERTGAKHVHSRYCTKPVRRREWRTLQQQEQLAYLGAVICLANTPSRSRAIGTIYDDFAFVHMQIGAHGEEKPIQGQSILCSNDYSPWRGLIFPMASHVPLSMGETSP